MIGQIVLGITIVTMFSVVVVDAITNKGLMTDKVFNFIVGSGGIGFLLLAMGI